MSALLEVAIGYAARAWPVFPLAEGGKAPKIPKIHPVGHPCRGECGRDGHGFYDATSEPTKIRSWWTHWPNANVGLPTGANFDCLDLDGPQAETELDQALQASGSDEYLIGPTVRTPRGWHFYCQPTGLGNRAGILPGVDWRGIGGYVVAPGSSYPHADSSWWWELPDDPDYGADAPIRPAPAWLVDLLTPKVSHAHVQLRRPGDRYGHQALDAECGRLAIAAEGTRNDSLCRASFRLGQLVAAGLVDAGTVIDSLGAVALRVGLDEQETKATIRSGLTAGMAQPRRTG